MKFVLNERHHRIYKGDYEDWFDDKTNEYLNAIKLSDAWCTIDDILDLAKVDSGKNDIWENSFQNQVDCFRNATTIWT
jgi:hypothetical protein